jgi:hypothetical protein
MRWGRVEVLIIRDLAFLIGKWPAASVAGFFDCDKFSGRACVIVYKVLM